MIKLSPYWACVILCFVSSQLHAAKKLSVPRSDGRHTPLTLYGNWKTKGCTPTLLLSHNLGGSEKSLSFYANRFARKGRRAVVIGHAESGKERYRKTQQNALDEFSWLLDPYIYQARQYDLDAAYNFVTSSCKPIPLLMMGHEMGSTTALIEAGAMTDVPFYGEDRFDAYIALSPDGVGWRFDYGAWRNIRKSVLMVTGTKDDSKDGDYTSRYSAFEGLPRGRKRYVIIPGANNAEIGGMQNRNVQKRVMEVIWEYLRDASQPVMPRSRLNGLTAYDK